MDILGLGYLGFESPNAKAWSEYGPEVLGLGLCAARAGDDSIRLRMDDRSWRIALHPGERNRVAYIGWELRHRPAYEAAVDKLRRAGIAVAPGDKALCELRGVHEVARFRDPVGYDHELFYGQEFHPRSFVPGRPHAGFVAEERGVGHIVLTMPKPSEEIHRFCMDVMGFTWFGYGANGPGSGGFYRAKLNARSHNIAYGVVPGRFGVHHIGLETRELDDVGISYDAVQERKIPLQITLGRHTQDPVVSFYSFTPSGFVVEYLHGGALMPEETFHEVRPQRLSVWGHKLVGPPLPETVAPVGPA